MPAADAPAFAPISDRMCTTAMAAAKGMLPSHDDSAMLQWRREAVQHRVNSYRKKHVRVTQAKEQAMQNMAKLQQHQVSIFLLQSERSRLVQPLCVDKALVQRPETSVFCVRCTQFFASRLPYIERCHELKASGNVA